MAIEILPADPVEVDDIEGRTRIVSNLLYRGALRPKTIEQPTGAGVLHGKVGMGRREVLVAADTDRTPTRQRKQSAIDRVGPAVRQRSRRIGEIPDPAFPFRRRVVPQLKEHDSIRYDQRLGSAEAFGQERLARDRILKARADD